MASFARVEELSDSDPDEVDIASIQSPISKSVIEATRAPAAERLRGDGMQDIDKAAIRDWTCIYPIYFDATRTRADGRRVGKAMAVTNPLARQIVDAVAELNLKVVFEPGKCHPKDWANPGRVKVQFKERDGVKSGFNTKRHLFQRVAEYLKLHPTLPTDPLKLRIPGLPPPREPLPPPAAPKGWHMGTILPLHSPAVTGGGVSENLFKDMMAGMQGQQLGQADSSSGGKSKKEKKKLKG